MRVNRLCLAFMLILAGCSSGSEEKTEVVTEPTDEPHTLVGDWRNVGIIVRMPDSTLVVGANEWENKLGIKPIITSFTEEGGFVSEDRSPGDSLLMTSTGSWSVADDTLSMIEHGSENKYYYYVVGDTVFFRGYLDWDQDGEANDHYVGKQVRIE